MSTDIRDHKKIATKRVVLVGHPNVGKSVLFNTLTGRYVMVSNYPGTTVDIARGVGFAGAELMEFIDSPGIHCLVVTSDEEKATRSLLLGRPDLLVQVGDSKNLSRTLMLTLELGELGIPMALCLNMKDEALSRGLEIDVERLSKILGIPVVETVATTQEGIKELREAFFKATLMACSNEYPREVAKSLHEISSAVPERVRFLCPLLLQNHTTPEDLPEFPEFWTPQVADKLRVARNKFVRPVSTIFMESRQEQASRITAEVLGQPFFVTSTHMERWMQKLGRWSLRPWPGYLIAAAVLWGLYEFVGVFGAQTCVDFLEEILFGKYINPAVTQVAHGIIPWAFARNLLVGEYGIFTMALTYAFALILPIVTTFFLALGVLEDTGYLPRLSVLLDRFFKLMGLNGKAVFPMILGLGCGTMAMLTARILDTKKEKLLVSFLLALAVPCSAQLGVIFAMSSGLSPVVLVLWLFVVLASLLGVGWLTSKVLPGAAAPFLIEIPPLRVPQMKNLLRKVWARLRWYLWEVIPLFIYGTAALYFLDVLGWLKRVETFAAPVITGLLGLPEKATQAFLVGFLRRDYGAAGLYEMQRQGLLNLRQSAVSIIAITLFMPCIAQWLMSLRERGLKVTLVMTAVVTAYALIVSGMVNHALLALGWV